jgi:amidophosphoribosyltransferase
MANRPAGDGRRVTGFRRSVTRAVPLDKFHEECGVVAVWRDDGAVPAVHRALFELQHRGQEAAGIVSSDPDGEVHIAKGRGLIAEGLPVERIEGMPGANAIGHCRYSTVGIDEHTQPIVANTPYGQLAIAHNGNIKNADELRQELERDGAIVSTAMDTELLVHLIARSHASDFPAALRTMAEAAVGAYSLVMLCAGRVYALRDPNGLRPLVLGEMKQGWVIASETCALDVLHAEYVREIEPGELVTLGPDGVTSTQLLPSAERTPCVFELVYFSRPNSIVFGESVNGARVRMGVELARADAADPGPPVDIVVPVPDSGVPAAIGYARESGVMYEKAILRSHYVGRTFILPDQDSRASQIGLKLSVIRDAVEGKRVLLVDDSIVRGNTSRQIVRMLREGGAASVSMRVASPPLAWPCYLGIDTPTRDELVINRAGSVQRVTDTIGADDLRYLSVDGLRRAAGGGPFCMACMTGEYPV